MQSLPIRALLVSLLTLLVGCASNPDSGALSPRDTEGLRASERTVRPVQPAGRPAAAPANPASPALVIAGQTLTMAEIAPYLAEAAGGQILEELLITRIAERDLARAGLMLTQADIDNERLELARALAGRDIPADPDQLIQSVRRARGLGEQRFALLVRRTAALRKLVASEVTVTDEEVALAHQVRHGPRYRVRLIMAATERDAAQTLAELRALDPVSRRARFIELAMDRSIDASSAAGGLLEPISPADPAYPAVVRSALTSLQPGDLSPVLALNPNYAIVLAEEIIPADGAPLHAVASALRDDLRRRQERLLMDRRAAAILEAGAPTILDPSLQWSWRARQDRRPD